MDIRYLQEFVFLAEICNFQEAAYRLHMSQSSLTKHIQRLEEELNAQLFDRSTRSVKLNQAGATFYDYAVQILQLYADALNSVTEINRELQNKITISFMPSLGQYGIIETIAAFSKLHPDISEDIIERNDFIDALLSGRCDFVFAPEDAFEGNDLKRIIFKRDCLSIVFPEDHPLANEEFVTLSQVQNENFVEQTGSISPEGKAFAKYFAQYGFEPKIVGSSAFSATISRMVSSGKGCAVMYHMHVHKMAGIKIVDIFPEIPFNVCLFYLRSHHLNAAQQAFVDYIKNLEPIHKLVEL